MALQRFEKCMKMMYSIAACSQATIDICGQRCSSMTQIPRPGTECAGAQCLCRNPCEVNI